ncbi:uncharacterized protein LOC131665903 [Phymastichus coffea]|uniref:uncharacterized protein LOC131665903 n=1 Tax=Phymastichus coffea TaxID=108790 RepID=UPI00273C95D0|nr:uncharacterized protein LOC131665903 [Phymastichus coffea]
MTMLGLSLNFLSHYQNQHFKWNVEHQRKHWILSKHCNDVLFAKSLRNLPLISFEVGYIISIILRLLYSHGRDLTCAFILKAKFYWHQYVSKKKYDKCFERELRNMLNSTLLKASSRQNISVEHILISKQLINLDKYDPLTRRNFIQMTVNFIRNQSSLEIVCLEGLDLTINEISEILLALVWSNKCIKFLMLWRVFKYHAKPRVRAKITDAEGFDKATFSHLPKWLQAITNLKYLESISLNYTYIASETGKELIFLAKSLNKCWKILQLLCLKKEITVTIPDCTWNEVRKWSPKIRVQFIILGISEYDQHSKFLTKSIPIQALHLSTNLELLSHYPCMIDCTLKIIYRWYHRHLVKLYLSVWNVQETFDNHLRKIFPCLPNLETFEFLGFIQDVVTIHTMCCQVRFGVCAVRNIDLRLTNINKSEMRDSAWISRLECILEPFKCDFDAAGISFRIQTYPC